MIRSADGPMTQSLFLILVILSEVRRTPNAVEGPHVPQQRHRLKTEFLPRSRDGPQIIHPMSLCRCRGETLSLRPLRPFSVTSSVKSFSDHPDHLIFSYYCRSHLTWIECPALGMAVLHRVDRLGCASAGVAHCRSESLKLVGPCARLCSSLLYSFFPHWLSPRATTPSSRARLPMRNRCPSPRRASALNR